MGLARGRADLRGGALATRARGVGENDFHALRGESRWDGAAAGRRAGRDQTLCRETVDQAHSPRSARRRALKISTPKRWRATPHKPLGETNIVATAAAPSSMR